MENLSAGDVELSTEDLAEIAQLLEKSPRKGARHVGGLTEQQLHLLGLGIEMKRMYGRFVQIVDSFEVCVSLDGGLGTLEIPGLIICRDGT